MELGDPRGGIAVKIRGGEGAECGDDFFVGHDPGKCPESRSARKPGRCNVPITRGFGI